MFPPIHVRNLALSVMPRASLHVGLKADVIAVLPYSLLFFVFIAAGLLGHDPWKADEAYVFGVVQQMFESGDWVVPRLAGEPFMEKPPLFYWTAMAFVRVTSHLLPMHDGARMASGFFMLLTCCALGATARTWWGPGAGRYSVLILVGCLGTLVQSHMMMPDVPLLTGFALSALGFASVLSKPRVGGMLLGLAVGTAFLSKGLIGPVVMGTTALVLPLCFANWRTIAYWKGLAIAALVSAPALLIWPALLYARAPALFIDWFWVNNIGRFLGFSVPQLGAEHLPWFWTQTIPWFTFPGLPLAMFTLWQQRRRALSEPRIQFAVTAFVVLMLLLAVSSSARCVYGWPLMIPIALLAAPAARALPALVERVWIALSAVLFGFFVCAIWAGWTIMTNSGVAPDWRFLRRVLPAEFVPHFEIIPVAGAVLITGATLVGARILWDRPARGLTVWVLGLTLTWSLLTTLWMPWLDFAKSYRSVFASMPLQDTGCLASLNLGEGERAMLRYVTGHNSMRVEVMPNADCKALLVQREAAFGEPAIDPILWEEVWRGSRPGITNERFWLFQRRDDTELFNIVEDEWIASLGFATCRQTAIEDSEICED